MEVSRLCESFRVIVYNGSMFYFQIPQHIHFFSGVIIELKMMVSGLSHLLGRVKVRLGPEWTGHLPRCCGRAETAQE